MIDRAIDGKKVPAFPALRKKGKSSAKRKAQSAKVRHEMPSHLVPIVNVIPVRARDTGRGELCATVWSIFEEILFVISASSGSRQDHKLYLQEDCQQLPFLRCA